MQHPFRSGGFPALTSSFFSSTIRALERTCLRRKMPHQPVSPLHRRRSHLRHCRFASCDATRTRTTRTKPITHVTPIERSIERNTGGDVARARQFPRNTVVPAQTRRGNWEILRTDGSGSRLVLLLLLRPLAPSIVHTVRGKSAEKETRVMRGCTLRRERDALWRMRMLGSSTGCPVYPRKRDEPGRTHRSHRRGVDRIRVGFADFLSAFVGFPALAVAFMSHTATVIVKVRRHWMLMVVLGYIFHCFVAASRVFWVDSQLCNTVHRSSSSRRSSIRRLIKFSNLCFY